jgi:hypothetical protein
VISIERSFLGEFLKRECEFHFVYWAAGWIGNLPVVPIVGQNFQVFTAKSLLVCWHHFVKYRITDETHDATTTEKTGTGIQSPSISIA